MQSVRYNDTEDTSDNKNPMCYLSKISHKPFLNIKFNNTSSKEIERVIKSVRVKNSHGHDGITTKMLEVSAPYMSSPLNYICNKSIMSGTFPSCLKYPIVKPLFKKGDMENMANYRPVSLLTSFSKVFVRIVYERLLQHSNINNILVEEQFGFRPATSTDPTD
jgi:Notch-like protein